MPRVVIVGASLVGLMVALRLQDVGCDVVVLDCDDVRPDREVDASAPPLPLDGPDASAFARWADRSRVYPRPVDAGVGAIVDVDAWWLAALADAHAAGVVVRCGHRVVGVATTASEVAGVRTDQGPLAADVLVVAAGAAAVGITPALGVQLPVVPESAGWLALPGGSGSAEIRQLAPPGGATGSVHAAVFVHDARPVAWFGAYRSFGASGARRDELARGYVNGLIESERGRGSASDAALVWRRHAHCTTDHRAVVGAVPRLPTLVLALPHGPFGNAAAVRLVEAAVRAATGAEPHPADASWSPARFPQGATGGRMKAVA